jgi:hypothetical protein
MTTKDVYRFDATWYEPTDDGKGGSRKFSDACVRAADYDADLASVEAERDSLQADSTRAITVVAGLIAERDALRAKGEKLAEAVGRVQGMLDAVDPSSRTAVEIQTICDAALEEWRNE